MQTVRKEKAKMQVAPRRSATVAGFPELGSKAKPHDVIGLGENSLDTLVDVGRYPEPDSKQVVNAVRPMVGGQVATAMVAVARLGWRARYVGSVGDDEAGRQVRRGLDDEGVRGHIVVRERAATRGAIILIERQSGRRTVLEHRDARVALRPSEIAARVVTSGRILLLDARDPEVSSVAATLARAAGIPVVLDIEHVRPGVRHLLTLVDVIVCTETFPKAMTRRDDLEEGLRTLADRSGAGVVIATRGAKGSIAIVGGQTIRTPGFRVAAVDTTGAGDAFRGGLLAGWLGARPGDSAAQILRYANAVAALNCTGFGAQTALPTRRQVAAFVTARGHAQSK
jgi:sugar/nucleoside kinase (ribokinase family)